jgi:uncharacterized SAM-binding protein YcdF (DUF218 family)
MNNYKTMNDKLKSIIAITILTLGVVIIIGTIFSESILKGIAGALVHEDTLVKAEAIVVLAGSGSGNRIKAGAKLYHDGFGDKLVFSGFKVYPGTYTSTLMKSYAMRLKVREDRIITTRPTAEDSTRGESMSNLKLLQENKIKKFILVTSAYHTRRANLIYKRAVSLSGYDMEFLVYPAKDPRVPIQSWWKIRTGQKSIVSEYAKSIAFYFNL